MKNSHTPTRPAFPTFEQWLTTRRPIQGGDGTEPPKTPGTEVAAEAAAMANAQPSGSAETASTPSGGTSGAPEDQGFDTPFRLEDIEDEAVREQVSRYNRQIQGAYTRKTQELAQERAELASARELQQNLSSTDEATRDAAIRQILKDAGWDYDEDESAQDNLHAAQAAGTEPAAAPAADPALLNRLDELEAREQQREQDAYLSEFRSRVDAGLEKHFKELGIKDQSAKEAESKLIGALLQTVAPIDGRWPDMDAVLALRQADIAAQEQRVVARYRQSKDVPATPAGGASGRSATAERTQTSRRQRALEIAGRHLP